MRMSDIQNQTTDAQKESDTFNRVFVQQDKPMISQPTKKRKIATIIGVSFLVFFIILIISGFFAYTKAIALKGKADDLQVSAKEAYDALKAQNLVLADTKLTETHGKLDAFTSEYKTLSWVGAVPLAN